MRGSTDPAARPSNANLSKSRIGDVSLGNVSIVDGSVHYRDARVATDETASAINAQFALANIASPLDVKGDFVWRNESVQVTAEISPFRALLEGRPIEAHVKTSAAPLQLSFDGVMTMGADLDFDGHVKAEAATIDGLSRWIGRPIGGSLPGGFTIDAKLKQTATLTALSDARLSLGALTGNGTCPAARAAS